MYTHTKKKKILGKLTFIKSMHIPKIIVTTGSASKDQIGFEKEVGFNVAGYLKKPFTPEQLYNVLSTVLK